MTITRRLKRLLTHVNHALLRMVCILFSFFPGLVCICYIPRAGLPALTPSCDSCACTCVAEAFLCCTVILTNRSLSTNVRKIFTRTFSPPPSNEWESGLPSRGKTKKGMHRIGRWRVKRARTVRTVVTFSCVPPAGASTYFSQRDVKLYPEKWYNTHTHA